MEYIKAYTASNTIIIALKSRLEELNIKSVIQDNVSASLHAGFGEQLNNVDLLIHKNDVVKSKPILIQFDQDIKEKKRK